MAVADGKHATPAVTGWLSKAHLEWQDTVILGVGGRPILGF
jgi:hypothetical protein